MAIDSLRKRASIASLGLAFLGPSVVPDATLGQLDRQTIANSYYGISAGTSIVEIGGTSQIGAYSATGGLTLERIIGGTSQLAVFDATGGITLERTLGATAQINAFRASGGIQVGDFVGAGGTPNRKKRKRENLDELRRAAQAAMLRRRKAEELEAKVEQQIEKAVKTGATIEYDPQAMRIAKITEDLDRAIAIEFEAKRQADEQLKAEEETRKRRKRDQLAVMLLLH